MGKIIDNEQFFLHLSQMYAGTKKWGTVRVLVKRLFEEQFKHKLTKRKDQNAYELQVSQDKTHEFDIVVKAANPKRKVTTIVKASNSMAFQRNLVTLMQQQMFKDIKAQVAPAKGKKAKKEDAKGDKKGAKETKKVEETKVPRHKKNRKDRRKDQRKDRRRDIKKKRKEEKIKLQADTAQDNVMKEE